MLYGNTGIDSLVGGDGADTFVLADATHLSSVLDFQSSQGDVVVHLAGVPTTGIGQELLIV